MSAFLYLKVPTYQSGNFDCVNRFSKESDPGRKFRVGIEWNRVFSGKDFRKFKTTFSVFPKSGNFGIFENSRVPFKSFQSDCLNTYDKRRQEA